MLCKLGKQGLVSLFIFFLTSDNPKELQRSEFPVRQIHFENTDAADSLSRRICYKNNNPFRLHKIKKITSLRLPQRELPGDNLITSVTAPFWFNYRISGQKRFVQEFERAIATWSDFPKNYNPAKVVQSINLPPPAPLLNFPFFFGSLLLEVAQLSRNYLNYFVRKGRERSDWWST